MPYARDLLFADPEREFAIDMVEAMITVVDRWAVAHPDVKRRDLLKQRPDVRTADSSPNCVG